MSYRDSPRQFPASPEVAIAAFDAPHEAHLAVMHLDTQGISARIQNDLVVGMAPHLGGAMGGVQVLVRQVDAEEAYRSLETLRQELQAERASRRQLQAEAAPPRTGTRRTLTLIAVLTLLGLWVLLQLR